jgi:pimeloyl-ACP methyl ester carboxylesterase
MVFTGKMTAPAQSHGVAAVRRGSVAVDGVTSPTWESGPADAAEAVLFVHGLPGSGEDFVGLLSAIGAFGIRALSFDLPGFGQADKPPDFDYSSFGFADHIGGVLRARGVSAVHLVTHDFGGGWALEWAVREPTPLRSAVSINTGLVGERMHWLPRVWRTPVIGEMAQAVAQIPLTRMLLWHGNPRGLPRSFVDGMYANYDRGTRRAVLRMYRRIEMPKPMLDRLARVLAPLDLPALVVWGVHDPYIPLRCAERLQLLFPSAEFVYLEDSGHWPFIDNPEAAAGAIVPFLRDQVAVKRAAGE